MKFDLAQQNIPEAWEALVTLESLEVIREKSTAEGVLI